MKKLALSLFAVALTIFGLGTVATMSPAYAVVYCPNGTVATGNDLSQCSGLANSNNNGTDLMTILNIVINVVLGVVAFVAVVMIILGGINFITSQGDSSKVSKARNTVLYGVVGLVVALLAFAIVNFVLKSIFK